MVDDHVAVAVAGITADANILINQARLHAQRYRFSFQEPQPVEQLVQSLCDEKQAYTQYGGLRPFGVSMLYAGWDKTYGFQLYQSDPSGNYNGWKAKCIGMNNQTAESLMKQEYKEEAIPMDQVCAHRCARARANNNKLAERKEPSRSLRPPPFIRASSHVIPPPLLQNQALSLAIKVLTKTCDATSLTPDKFDLATLTRNADGKITYHEYSTAESQALLDAAKAEEATGDA